jgi:DnaJ family protein C protein 11
MASVGSEHKISQYIRVGMSLECGVPMGIVVKFR